jgi:hypothetical protein
MCTCLKGIKNHFAPWLVLLEGERLLGELERLNLKKSDWEKKC